MAHSTQKQKVSLGRTSGGIFFLLLALTASGLATLVFVLYVFKQNNLPWTLNTVLLAIIALAFFVVSIGLFMPVSSEVKHDDINHCPKCGHKLRQRHLMNARCPNSQCHKVLGPEDFDAHFCTSCGTNVLQTIGQITGQFPAIKKDTPPPKFP